MRRGEREIAERREIDAILARVPVLYLGLLDGGRPYVVPVNFGYDGRNLYIHSAAAGRKIEALRREPEVSFVAVDGAEVVPAAEACRWTSRYRSVMGTGTVFFLEDAAAKGRALDCLLRKFAPGPFRYDPAALARTAVLRIEIREVTGKRGG